MGIYAQRLSQQTFLLSFLRLLQLTKISLRWGSSRWLGVNATDGSMPYVSQHIGQAHSLSETNIFLNVIRRSPQVVLTP